MIHEVLNFLKDGLNEYFKIKAGIEEDKVSFLDGSNMDPVSFPLNAITPYMINIHEDRIYRKADQYLGVTQNGIRTHINPVLRLNLQVLFVSKFSDYNQSLYFLSYVIKYFQSHRVFDNENSPSLNSKIHKLIPELVTLPLSEQDNIWNALRTTYLPSVLYKISVITFEDDENIEVSRTSAGIERNLKEM